ncbi:SURF1 family protein [Streptomyces sp. NBC_01775]|uniref:SURF1 family cytochrome oxidase biogenesis protein n=1 Tax=Streptomyces sp. NBC_01775 TaxID=2975939 RepID=UPI002DDA86B4|nr:SURF1 family cytochrome oxidase biogenesis protein [Streptomyces sp. NBC_01775]WSB80094.1 SURF1 family protein [Streptomyces sp. NBC_01775]
MYRFLLSRQWVILTLLGLVLIPSMIKLGFWQLHRHESRVARNEEVAASLSAATVPVGTLTDTRDGPADDDKFRTVTARGTYDEKHEVVVRHRTGADGDTIGYFVVTPLIRKDGPPLLVNRGWIKADRDLTAFPSVPPAPKGEVAVKGRLMPDETTGASGIKDTKGLPDRQVMLINSKQQAKALGRPLLGGFVQLTATAPKPQGHQPELLPEPDHSGIGPHMAYAVQWWLFTGAVPVGWVILVRREAQERRRAAAGGPGEAPGGSTAQSAEPAEPTEPSAPAEVDKHDKHAEPADPTERRGAAEPGPPAEAGEPTGPGEKREATRGESFAKEPEPVTE